MINYASAIKVLDAAGYKMTNKCYFDGESFQDFNSRKRDASISLVIDEASGCVSRIEITTRKWSDKLCRYEPVKEILTGLQGLVNKLGAPSKPITL